MQGCSPLTGEEILKISEILLTTKGVGKRNYCLFMFGLYTGFRISEILSVKVKDVKDKEWIRVPKKEMKGKTDARTVVLHPRLINIIDEYLKDEKLQKDDYLFPSNKRDKVTGKRGRLNIMQGYRIIRDAATKAGLRGVKGTHMMRKTFAKKVFESSDKDILKTMKLLGHRQISSTIFYLESFVLDLDDIVSKIEL